jgi:hypothetical protein
MAEPGPYAQRAGSLLFPLSKALRLIDASPIHIGFYIGVQVERSGSSSHDSRPSCHGCLQPPVVSTGRGCTSMSSTVLFTQLRNRPCRRRRLDVYRALSAEGGALLAGRDRRIGAQCAFIRHECILHGRGGARRSSAAIA